MVTDSVAAVEQGCGMTCGDVIVIAGQVHIVIGYSVSGHLVTVTREARGITVWSDGVAVGRTAPTFPLVRKEEAA